VFSFKARQEPSLKDIFALLDEIENTDTIWDQISCVLCLHYLGTDW